MNMIQMKHVPIETVNQKGQPLGIFDDYYKAKERRNVRTWARALIESAPFQDLIRKRDVRNDEFRLRIMRPHVEDGFAAKDMTSTTAGSVANIDRQFANPTPLPRDEPVIRDLLMPGNTKVRTVQFIVTMSATHAAAGVLETFEKPKSDFVFAIGTATVGTISHFVRVSRQLFDDSDSMRAAIDGDLTYDLQYAEDDAFLNGNGADGFVDGIIGQATPYGHPTGVSVVGETPIDRLQLALAQARLAKVEPDAIVLRPNDYENMLLLKDGGGGYVAGWPTDPGPKTLWKKPVVTTLAMPAGKFLVGAFKTVQLFDRQEIDIVVATSNSDDFEQNMLTIRAEERAALAVRRPEAIITGSLTS